MVIIYYIYIYIHIYIYIWRHKNNPIPILDHWTFPSGILPVSFRYPSGMQVFLHDCSECHLKGDLAPFRCPSGILPVSFRYAGALIHFGKNSLEPPPLTRNVTRIGGYEYRQTPKLQINQIKLPSKNPSGALPVWAASGQWWDFVILVWLVDGGADVAWPSAA